LTVTDTVTGDSGDTSEISAPISPDIEATWVWITGAQLVNADSGVFANFIRNYTASEYFIRTGETINAAFPGADEIQVASNEVATNFSTSFFMKLLRRREA
jgi:hypothetical protein